MSVIFNKWEILIKLFFTVFVRFKLRCKMSGVILKCAKSVSYERTGFFSSKFRDSYKKCLKIFF